MKYLLCGKLVDGTGAEPRENVVLAIEDERIAAIMDAADYKGDRDALLDYSGYTITPGFIDCHDHFCLDPGDEAAQCSQSIVALTIHSAANAARILRSGITTMRDCGELSYIDIALKAAIEKGDTQGPRIVTSGYPIMRTGGHGYFLGREADGVDEVRKAVREQLKAGVDMIKLIPSGGMSTRGSSPVGMEMTKEEIEAAIDEAHRAGRKIAIHVHGGPGAVISILAGADSIEHCLLFTEDELKLLAEHGTFLVSTSGLSITIMEDPDCPAFYRKKVEQALENSAINLRIAKSLGAKVACGNDTNHGRMDLEIRALVEGSYTPLEAVTIATRNGAELCGLLDDVGTLEVGKYADLLAFAGDPLTDLDLFHAPSLVMKGGMVEFEN